MGLTSYFRRTQKSESIKVKKKVTNGLTDCFINQLAIQFGNQINFYLPPTFFFLLLLFFLVDVFHIRFSYLCCLLYCCLLFYNNNKNISFSVKC